MADPDVRIGRLAAADAIEPVLDVRQRADRVQIILAGGALPQNIYWATFAAASLDTTSKFKGTILSQSEITMKTGATINGRLLAGTAVNLDQNTVGP